MNDTEKTMQKRMTNELVWIFTGVSLVGVGMLGGLEACSSDNPSGKDASADVATKDAVVDQSSADTGPGPQDAGADCKADPKLHPSTPGTIFCGFGDAGSFNCSTGQECCLGGKQGTGFAPETCATFGSTCTNGTGPVPIECEQPEDCTANGMTGAACCLQGGSAPQQVAGCDTGDLVAKGGTAIVCEASDAGSADGGVGTCASGALQVCEAQSDCPTGKTCTPTRWKLYEIGVCL